MQNDFEELRANKAKMKKMFPDIKRYYTQLKDDRIRFNTTVTAHEVEIGLQYCFCGVAIANSKDDVSEYIAEVGKILKLAGSLEPNEDQCMVFHEIFERGVIVKLFTSKPRREKEVMESWNAWFEFCKKLSYNLSCQAKHFRYVLNGFLDILEVKPSKEIYNEAIDGLDTVCKYLRFIYDADPENDECVGKYVGAIVDTLRCYIDENQVEKARDYFEILKELRRTVQLSTFNREQYDKLQKRLEAL